MTEIISIRFKSGGRQYYFDPVGMTIEPNQGVIVETSRGLEYGECVQGNRVVEDSDVVLPLRPVIRIATEHDLDIVKKNQEREIQAFDICQAKILEHELDMKLVSVEQNFEGNKLLFFFTAENRVDFRALVKDLAATFHTRIELRQIGVRDEAKLLGGLGICGKPFCCSTFLGEFQPVSIKMAKTQNLSLNPTKISGTCGRLMCCLKYEQDAYEDAVRRCPKLESFVETPDGVGTITNVNLLREQVKVHIEDSDDSPKTYLNTEINVVRSGKGKRPEGYVVPPKVELEKLRRVAENKKELRDDGERTALSAALESIFNHDENEGFAQSSNDRGKNGRNRKHNGDNRRPENDSRKNAGENRESLEKNRKPSQESRKIPSEGKKFGSEGDRPMGENKKFSNEKRSTEKKQMNPAAFQSHKNQSGDSKKSYNRNHRRPYRGKPRNSGEGSDGSRGNSED